MKLGILISGNLGYIVLQDLCCKYEIIFVFTDSKSKSIIEFCQKNQIALFTGNPRNGKAKDFYSSKPIDVLVSVNYLFLIEEDLIAHPSILAFNLHGSLLPKYRGRTPHVWAIINNENQTGITAHLIDKGCDTGDIIHQVTIDIDQKDTGAMILNKYSQKYIPLIDQVLFDIKNQKLITRKQNDSEATYFGKRSPEDGAINWNWQKERINNWVRAQADPYPGAFSQINGKKIIIDEVQFSSLGFDWEMINGLVLSINPLSIKTPNGVLEISKYRSVDFEITVGSILE